MSRTVQFKRYANTTLANITGASGELIVDSTNHTITVHDGSTPGGTRLATETFVSSGIAINNNIVNSAYNQANNANTLAQSAYNQANATNILAQAAFDKANTGGGNTGGSSSGYLANSVIFANAAGYLSNTSNFTFDATSNTLTAGNITGSALNMTIQPLAPISGAGGTLNIKARNGATTSGGAINLTAGNGAGTGGVGGIVTLRGGNNYSGYNAGAIFQTRAGSLLSGGDVRLTAGAGADSGSSGGNLLFTLGYGSISDGSILFTDTYSNYFLQMATAAPSGALQIGFFGATPVSKPTPTASGTGSVLNSIASSLSSLGLISNTNLTNITSTDTLAQAAFDKANTDVTSISATAGVYGNSTIIPVTTIAANGRVTSIVNTAISGINIGTTAINPGGTTTTLGGLTSVTVTQDATSALQLVTKQYVDAAVSNTNYHTAVQVTTTAPLTATYNNGSSGIGANLTNSGAQSALVIDTYTTLLNDRVLVKNQTLANQNGVYVVTANGSVSTNWVLTRTSDYDQSVPGEVAAGDYLFVGNGTTYGNTAWVMSTPGTIVIGTTSINFVQIAGPGTYTANAPLVLTGTQFGLSVTGTAATYGNSAYIPVLTTDAYGRVSAVSNTAISIPISQVVGLQGLENSQNTNISAANTLAQGAFDKANSSNTLAQAAFNKANTSVSSSGYLANSVIFANTTGYLSNTANLSFISSNNALFVGGNTYVSGSGQFGGIYDENSTTVSLVAGVAGTGTPTPRIGFFNGASSQNWQIDNSNGNFRWFTPGVTRMQLDPTGYLTLLTAVTSTSNATGSLVVAGGAGIKGSVYSGGIYITGPGNGITFVDGTVQTTNAAPFAYTQAAYDTANNALANTGFSWSYQGTTGAGQTYTMVFRTPMRLTITETATQCDSGSDTATIKINGVAIGGISHAVSSTANVVIRSSSNIVAVTNNVTITFVNGGAVNPVVSVRGTKG
jgi:hypothetical protein